MPGIAINLLSYNSTVQLAMEQAVFTLHVQVNRHSLNRALNCVSRRPITELTPAFACIQSGAEEAAKIWGDKIWYQDIMYGEKL